MQTTSVASGCQAIGRPGVRYVAQSGHWQMAALTLSEHSDMGVRPSRALVVNKLMVPQTIAGTTSQLTGRLLGQFTASTSYLPAASRNSPA
jgi:hypothetical protein